MWKFLHNIMDFLNARWTLTSTISVHRAFAIVWNSIVADG